MSLLFVWNPNFEKIQKGVIEINDNAKPYDLVLQHGALNDELLILRLWSLSGNVNALDINSCSNPSTFACTCLIHNLWTDAYRIVCYGKKWPWIFVASLVSCPCTLMPLRHRHLKNFNSFTRYNVIHFNWFYFINND